MAQLVGALLLLHLAEAVVWALFYVLVGALPDLETAVYFSLTSYTTVGYGDVVLPEPWRLLGPIEARGATVAGTQIHSVRLPSFAVSTEIVFAAAGERLTLRHDPGESPAPYVAGTLVAVRALEGRVGLTRGLDGLLS